METENPMSKAVLTKIKVPTNALTPTPSLTSQYQQPILPTTPYNLPSHIRNSDLSSVPNPQLHVDGGPTYLNNFNFALSTFLPGGIGLSLVDDRTGNNTCWEQQINFFSETCNQLTLPAISTDNSASPEHEGPGTSPSKFHSSKPSLLLSFATLSTSWVSNHSQSQSQPLVQCCETVPEHTSSDSHAVDGTGISTCNPYTWRVARWPLDSALPNKTAESHISGVPQDHSHSGSRSISTREDSDMQVSARNLPDREDINKPSSCSWQDKQSKAVNKRDFDQTRFNGSSDSCNVDF
jgi:hypothetical protein